MNTFIYSLFIMYIIGVNWINVEAKPFHISGNYHEDTESNQHTSYEEIRRMFQDDSMEDRQPTDTTSSMMTTTEGPTVEMDRDDNAVDDQSDDQSPCVGGGAVFTYTIHSDDGDGVGQIEFDSHGDENDVFIDDNDFFPLLSWSERDDYDFHRRQPRRPYRKPTRNSWHSRYDSFPF
uniref:Uncharacterized protein n=1 Tax=Schistosoma japonicum TaxID=6182 RepID=C1LMA5_SCHJA|nr:hypothetical protein [Schistosoma japonicum]